DNNPITGFIVKYDQLNLTLKQIDCYGRVGGINVVEIDSVETFSCDTEDEQDMKILYGENTKFGNVPPKR
ncbi:MAG: hypothetical protein ABF449_13720, partial [Ethanoligenens sp.]